MLFYIFALVGVIPLAFSGPSDLVYLPYLGVSPLLVLAFTTINSHNINFLSPFTA